MFLQSQFDFSETLFSPGGAIVVAFLGIITGIYIEKYKKRTSKIKYTLQFLPIATSSQNSYWGDITVLYNGNKTQHLSFVTLEIINDSNRDFENVDVDIWVDKDSRILGHGGNYNESRQAIYLEQVYRERLQHAADQNEIDIKLKSEDSSHVTPDDLLSEINWLLTNKKFRLPVFNRGTSITLNLLIENFKGKTPIVTPSILHQSINFIELGDELIEEKRRNIFIYISGLVVFIASLAIALWYYHRATEPLIIIGSLGILYLFIGVFIYRIFDYLRSFFK